MSYSVHPLFNTRGVPGTHEIGLVKKFFYFIKKKKFKKFKLLRFDKSTDDRVKKKYWLIFGVLQKKTNEKKNFFSYWRDGFYRIEYK